MHSTATIERVWSSWCNLWVLLSIPVAHLTFNVFLQPDCHCDVCYVFSEARCSSRDWGNSSSKQIPLRRESIPNQNFRANSYSNDHPNFQPHFAVAKIGNVGPIPSPPRREWPKKRFRSRIGRSFWRQRRCSARRRTLQQSPRVPDFCKCWKCRFQNC